MKELQSLALDVKVLDADGNEVELSDIIEEDTSRTPATIEEIDAAVDRAMLEGEEEEPMDDEEYDEDEDYEDEEVYDESEDIYEDEDNFDL